MKRTRTATLLSVCGMTAAGLLAGSWSAVAQAQAPVDPAARAIVDDFVNMATNPQVPVDQLYATTAWNSWGPAQAEILDDWGYTFRLRAAYWILGEEDPFAPSGDGYFTDRLSVDSMECTEFQCTAGILETLSFADDPDPIVFDPYYVRLEKTPIGWKFIDSPF